ncbi:hypothetical protein B0H14DRAFT_2675772 [Mycena olivaceomarginata]|nr:hypothetical protein B0H14DRAFT_2867663 [Mycena olivaceomarginata]KAJ7897954.1 hypothetical protein B0H14DRAFT_2675772 [Mycena olivaceomarginata]
MKRNLDYLWIGFCNLVSVPSARSLRAFLQFLLPIPRSLFKWSSLLPRPFPLIWSSVVTGFNTTCFYLSSGPVDLRRTPIRKLLCTSFAISDWSLSVPPHHQPPLKNPRCSILRTRLTHRPILNMVRFSTTIKYTSDALPQMCRSTVPVQSIVSALITLVPVPLHPMSP